MTLSKKNFLGAVLRKALFLDRDGVVNVEKNYLHTIEDFELMEGIIEVCRHYQAQGYVIIIVTNQSGIARGLYTEADFARLSEWMVEYFNTLGVTLTHIYHCPHHESIDGECECRKPNAGMFIAAQQAYDLNMAASVMIGDNERDIEAALKAGVQTNYLLSSSVVDSRATAIIHSLGELI